MTKSVEDRLVELEMRLAHQEQAVDDLSETIIRQNREIEALQFELKRQQSRLTTLAETREASPQDERPPPHY